jgi:hypothetical protein
MPVTRSVFAEVRSPGATGLSLFHINAVEDRPLRARWRAVAGELEPDLVLEESGQTMHFFSESYLRELLQEGASCISTRSRSPIAKPVRSSSRRARHRTSLTRLEHQLSRNGIGLRPVNGHLVGSHTA